MSKANPTKDKSHAAVEPATRTKDSRPQGQHQGRALERGYRHVEPRRSYALSPWESAGPFSVMRRFTEEMDRLFDDFGFGGLGRSVPAPPDLGRGGWTPQIELFEREGKLVVQADLPGMKREDLTVDIDDGGITIQGERRQEHEELRQGFYHSERSYGGFCRRIPLPDGVNAEAAKASFRDGVLEIELDAPKQQRGRRIEIADRSNG
jgi:HSP20 family protein